MPGRLTAHSDPVDILESTLFLNAPASGGKGVLKTAAGSYFEVSRSPTKPLALRTFLSRDQVKTSFLCDVKANFQGNAVAEKTCDNIKKKFPCSANGFCEWHE
mmetsp:Transcript_14585/g.25624  ORF Transcript_14585/g.25624 Transcript_14585/m.25624 type:complete len:103 (+) Transcript_14585:68-376(+)